MESPAGAEKAKQAVEQAVHKAGPSIERLARLGYATKGVVYLVVGGLAAAASIGAGGRTPDTRGALATVLDQPFGELMLAVVALGMTAYAAWRLIQALADPEHQGASPKGLVTRGAYGASALIHGSLALAALGMLMHWDDGGKNQTQRAAAAVLAQPLGVWLLGAIGGCVLAAALAQFYRAYSGRFRDNLLTANAAAGTRHLVTVVGRVGLTAYGLVLGLIGLFLVRAAFWYDANEAGGLADALQVIERQAYGPALLGIVSGGLVAYGLFELVKARYRWIRTS